MPNRMVRDWTDSEKVNLLSAEAERFFTRLIMKADDYGGYFADGRRLLPSLFPFLLHEITENELYLSQDFLDQVLVLLDSYVLERRKKSNEPTDDLPF